MNLEFLTTKELADLLKLQEQTVRLWAREGKIPCVKVGSDYRFIKEEVVNALRDKKREENN